MNKKAKFIYWLPGILLAGFVFYLAVSKAGFTFDVKGSWQTDFLQKNYFEAQKVLLKNDIVAKNVGTELALELAKNGGFKAGMESECGIFQDDEGNINLWNKAEQWCIPDVKKALAEESTEKFTTRLPGRKFLNIGYTDTLFHGRGQQEEIKSKVGVYKFTSDFGVDLGYSFAEYKELETEARKLVMKCRNKKNLPECLNDRLQSWYFGTCAEEVLSPAGRIIPFCIYSSYGIVPSFVEGIPMPQAVAYQLAFDFTPTEALATENVEATFNEELSAYEVAFDRDELAESYTVYYTNWQGAENNVPGTADEIFQEMPTIEEYGFWHDSVSVDNPAEVNCPAQKQVGEVYLCDDTVIYLLADSRLEESDTFLFAVTSHQAGKESSIQVFISVQS